MEVRYADYATAMTVKLPDLNLGFIHTLLWNASIEVIQQKMYLTLVPNGTIFHSTYAKSFIKPPLDEADESSLQVTY